jgi:hypothetical protein
MCVLSFAPYRPGFVNAHHDLWRELRNADPATPDRLAAPMTDTTGRHHRNWPPPHLRRG